MRQIELLAPVGKLENAYAAIENGANAIFVGGKMFSARYFADNFEDDELEKIVAYCKLRGVQVHVTVNTLIKQQEIPKLVEYVEYLNHLGVDALIIQDVGVANIIKKYFKDLVIHASTQMSAHSIEDVNFLKSKGFDRVVLAREVQLEDIKKIKEAVDIEIETFIHGALCYAYSGQCLMSSMIGGRSGNRGRCAQPCRMMYTLYGDQTPLVKDVYMLSPKDIWTLALLPQLIDAGIDSFKIEGRMKSPEYVAAVTGIYRKYIDLALENPKQYKIAEEDLATLQSIFNRGGFSEGYYKKKSGHGMMADQTPKNIGLKIGHVVNYNKKTKVATFFTNKTLHPGDGLEIWNSKKHVGTGISKVYEAGKNFSIPVNDPVEEGALVYLSKNHELLKALKRTYQKPMRKMSIKGQVQVKVNEPITFSLQQGKHQVTVQGDLVEVAQNQPMDQGAISKQLSKLGNTSFEMEKLGLEIEEGAYIPVSKLNSLRREAVEALEKEILKVNVNDAISYQIPEIKSIGSQQQYVVHVRTLEQLEAVLHYSEIKGIYWEWNNEEALAREAYEKCQKANKSFYLALPTIVKEKEWKMYKEVLCGWEQQPIEGYLIRNIGTFEVLKDSVKEKIVDYTLNIMNNEAIDYWIQQGVTWINPSLELSKKELKQLKGPLERIVYGHIPVMTTEQCVLGNYGKCKKKASKQTHYYLEDRKQANWPIITDCKACKMQLLSDQPLLLQKEQLEELKDVIRYRIWFSIENKKSVINSLEAILRNGHYEGNYQQGTFTKAID